MKYQPQIEIDDEDIQILETYAKEMRITIEQVLEYLAQDYINKIRDRWQSG